MISQKNLDNNMNITIIIHIHTFYTHYRTGYMIKLIYTYMENILIKFHLLKLHSKLSYFCLFNVE